jgi:hypothetical protein
MSLGALTRHNDANYSAARQDMLEDEREIGPQQDSLIDTVVMPDYELWFRFAAIEGRFDGVRGSTGRVPGRARPVQRRRVHRPAAAVDRPGEGSERLREGDQAPDHVPQRDRRDARRPAEEPAGHDRVGARGRDDEAPRTCDRRRRPRGVPSPRTWTRRRRSTKASKPAREEARPTQEVVTDPQTDATATVRRQGTTAERQRLRVRRGNLAQAARTVPLAVIRRPELPPRRRPRDRVLDVLVRRRHVLQGVRLQLHPGNTCDAWEAEPPTNDSGGKILPPGPIDGTAPIDSPRSEFNDRAARGVQ